MKLSVIVPVYNTAAWLPKCLNSLIDADKDGAYQIICVNDGSTDSSAAILEEYRSRFPDLIRVIETPNGGLGHARNTGLDAAEGDYVLFVDSDDYLTPGAISEMLALLEENPGIDLAVFDLVHVDAAGTELLRISGTEHETLFSFEEDPTCMFSPHNAVNRLWRRGLFTDCDIRFPEGILYEDLATVPKLLLHAGTILPVNRAWYCYYQHAGTIMSGSQAERITEMIDVAETVERFYRDQGAWETCLPELTYKFWYEELLASVTRVNRIDPKSEVQARLRDDYLKRFPNWRENPYVRRAPLRLRLLAAVICRGDWRAVRLLTDLNNKRKGR